MCINHSQSSRTQNDNPEHDKGRSERRSMSPERSLTHKYAMVN